MAKRAKFKVGQVVARMIWLESGKDGTFVRLRGRNECGPTWITDQGTTILEALLRPLTRKEQGGSDGERDA
jgi:hypothetical protein